MARKALLSSNGHAAYKSEPLLFVKGLLITLILSVLLSMFNTVVVLFLSIIGSFVPYFVFALRLISTPYRSIYTGHKGREKRNGQKAGMVARFFMYLSCLFLGTPSADFRLNLQYLNKAGGFSFGTIGGVLELTLKIF